MISVIGILSFSKIGTMGVSPSVYANRSNYPEHKIRAPTFAQCFLLYVPPLGNCRSKIFLQYLAVEIFKKTYDPTPTCVFCITAFVFTHALYNRGAKKLSPAFLWTLKYHLTNPPFIFATVKLIFIEDSILQEMIRQDKTEWQTKQNFSM